MNPLYDAASDPNLLSRARPRVDVGTPQAPVGRGPTVSTGPAVTRPSAGTAFPDRMSDDAADGAPCPVVPTGPHPTTAERRGPLFSRAAAVALR